MLRYWPIIIVSAGLLLVQSCASLSESECQAADWRTIGYEDGSKGMLPRRISAHREACADYGIAPNLNQYLAGHKEGVKQYCVAMNGFNLGQRGSSYNGVCSGESEYQFLRGYKQGKKVHALKQKISDLSRQVTQLHKEQHELEDEIVSNEELIVSDNTSEKLRKELLRQNKKLEQLILEREMNIKGLDHRITRLQRQMQRLVDNFRR